MTDAPVQSPGEPAVLDQWTARKVPPIVVLYVVAVFAAFAAVAHFVLHSAEALKSLAVAALGAVAATVPSVMDRVEYRLTGSGVEKRSARQDPGTFEELFRWSDVSWVVPTRRGFKVVTTTGETSPLRRLWSRYVPVACSCEVHVEREDLARVLRLLERQGVPVR